MDLSIEFDKILEESGKWVLLRHFSTTYTEYYDEVTKEAVDGPMFEYTDTVVRTFSTDTSFGMAMTADGITTVSAGDFSTKSSIYFLKKDIDVKNKDIIYELDWFNSDKPTVVYDDDEEDVSAKKVTPKRKAEVIKVVPLNSEYDEYDYKAIYTEEHHL